MIECIIKRDGKKVEPNPERISNAIIKAMEECDCENVDVDLAISIANEILDEEKGTIEVEKIQDLILKKLRKNNRKDVAKEYSAFRDKKAIERAKRSDLMKQVGEKLSATNVQNQNANVDEHSFGGRIGEASDIVLKDYALNNRISEIHRNNHLNNEVYIHDLNSYAVGSHNCMSIPFDDLLRNGFNTRQTDIRPANSINTAFQLLAVIFQLQSLQQFGGVSATHLDWTMIPYVRKSFYKHYTDGLRYFKKHSKFSLGKETIINTSITDKKIYKHNKPYNYAMEMTEKELEQSVEAMYHNLNSLQSRSGNQLPFTSINYGTCTLFEGRMVIRALLEGSIKGVGKFHKTSIFPCGIFQLGKGINREKEDPNYDLFKLALKSTAQRLYPNYANIDWSGNVGYDKNDPRTYFSAMGCRTANGFDINAEKGQNPQLKDGRGNICPNTIILPTIAMESLMEWNDEEEQRYDIQITEGMTLVDYFLEVLDMKIHEAKDQLLERFEWICSQSPKSASFMYENHIMYGYKEEEGIRSALKHGTLAIGQLGLAECLQILIGCDHTEEKGMEVAKRIEQLFKNRCAEFKEQYKLNFGVYYSPSENLCYTAMQKFKKEYGEIPNVSDKEFFTNSIHCPVWKEMNPFEKIDIESELTGYSSAGCITYIELDSSVKNNLEGLEKIVNYAMDKDIPYFAINVPNDMCNDCGYTDDIDETCPECGGNDIRRLRRVTGYLTGDYKTAFNKGKQQETEMRVKHKI